MRNNGLVPFLALLLAAGIAAAAEVRTDWWSDLPGFINQQHKHSLAAVSELLDKYPPALGESLEHRAALMLMDNVLHEQDAAARPAVQDFFIERTRLVCDALENTQVTQGARIWKLYDLGFVVRSAGATIAFDAVSGQHLAKEGFLLPDELIAALARQCDALFVSHLHLDHADPHVAEIFLEHGKPVAVPEKLWEDKPFAQGLIRLERTADREQSVPIRDGAACLRVVNGPGHQGSLIPNNVALVTTPDGLSFVHTGDQSNTKDFEWIAAIGKKHRVEVLMVNCWSPNLPRLIEGFDPGVVIPGHENELGHSIDHREPHWLNRARLGGEVKRAVFMTWGESYAYLPAAAR